MAGNNILASSKSNYNPPTQAIHEVVTITVTTDYYLPRNIVRFLITLLAIALVSMAILYYLISLPENPSFSITSLKIHQFNITRTSDDFSSVIKSKLDLGIAIGNPNEGVSFFYDPITLVFFCNDVYVGMGSYPSFRQRNLTAAFVSDSFSNSVRAIDDDNFDPSEMELMIQMKTKLQIKWADDAMSTKIGIQILCRGIRIVNIAIVDHDHADSSGISSSSTWKLSELSDPKCKITDVPFIYFRNAWY